MASEARGQQSPKEVEIIAIAEIALKPQGRGATEDLSLVILVVLSFRPEYPRDFISRDFRIGFLSVIHYKTVLRPDSPNFVAQAVRRNRAGVGTTRSLGEIGHRDAQRLKQGTPAAYARQQESFRFPEAARGSLSTQLKNARQQPQPFGVEGHQAFGVKLAEGNMQCPLFGPQVTLTIERQVGAFSNADSGDASQQESIGIQGIGATQFLLKPFIIFRRQRPWEILRTDGEIVSNNKTSVDGMALLAH